MSIFKTLKNSQNYAEIFRCTFVESFVSKKRKSELKPILQNVGTRFRKGSPLLQFIYNNTIIIGTIDKIIRNIKYGVHSRNCYMLYIFINKLNELL